MAAYAHYHGFGDDEAKKALYAQSIVKEQEKLDGASPMKKAELYIRLSRMFERVVGMCTWGSDWSARVNHNTLVYQYRLCYTMSLYCTGALSRSVT